MKKVVICLVVVVVVLLAAYTCSRMKDSSGETSVNAINSNETLKSAQVVEPVPEPKKEVPEEKADEPAAVQQKNEDKKPITMKDPVARKVEKREKAPIQPKEPTVTKGSRPEPAPKTEKPALKRKDDGANIDSAGVMKVIRASNAAIKRCYDRALVSNPSLQGKIAVKIVVNEEGRVGSVELSEDTLHDADVAKCVKGIISRLRFPKPEGGPATIVYPYSFSR